MLGWLEIAIIVVAVLVLFGGTRLPKLSSGIGRSIKNFKYAMRGDDEIKVTPRPSEFKTSDTEKSSEDSEEIQT